MRKARLFLVAALATTACKNARESDQPGAAKQAKAIEVHAEAQARTPTQSQTRTKRPAAPPGERSLAHGPLDLASANEIGIHRDATEPLYIKLDANTKIVRINSEPANITDLARGKQVTVTYRLDALTNQPVAESVRIVQ